jgi:hypothetical protein
LVDENGEPSITNASANPTDDQARYHREMFSLITGFWISQNVRAAAELAVGRPPPDGRLVGAGDR